MTRQTLLTSRIENSKNQLDILLVGIDQWQELEPELGRQRQQYHRNNRYLHHSYVRMNGFLLFKTLRSTKETYYP